MIRNADAIYFRIVKILNVQCVGKYAVLWEVFTVGTNVQYCCFSKSIIKTTRPSASVVDKAGHQSLYYIYNIENFVLKLYFM